MANRLAGETSPYLLQHANNPVDWYPWGEEALASAREQNRPIFLSIGYAACHWCHVMERESFEDESTADIMNEHFVNIKVDREERPDLDSIYMAAVTALTGRGGWPMSVWLTPRGEPFFGGTYFPDTPRHGMSSFRQVLEALAGAWENRPAEVAAAAAKLADRLRQDAVMPALSASVISGHEGGPTTLDPETAVAAVSALGSGFDATNGGWGHAPKFPQPMAIEFLLRRYVRVGDESARRMVERTLDRMAAGGIYDHVGGGFHRYSVDAVWLVPHFEKMLYDNSQLARVYLHAWQVLRIERYRAVVEETLDYVLREMVHPDGGFFSTQVADSEGEEGRFFVWTPSEIEAELGEEAALFMQAYGVESGGNFEGRSILFRKLGAEELAQLDGGDVSSVRASLARSRTALREARERRVHPARDDKVLAAWNGLMIAAFAEAGVALGRPDYVVASERAADFVLDRLRGLDGRLLRSWKDDRAHLNGYLEDHTHMIAGLLALYGATFDARWISVARELADTMLASFAAPGSGFYDTRDDHESLIVRPQDFQDNAVPSGNGMAATVLLELAALTGDRRYAAAAESALAAMEPVLASYPLAFGQWLVAFDAATGTRGEVAIIGAPDASDTLALLDVVREEYRPGWSVAVGREADDISDAEPADREDAADVALLEGRRQVGGRATGYVCRDFTCSAPISDPESLREALR